MDVLQETLWEYPELLPDSDNLFDVIVNWNVKKLMKDFNKVALGESTGGNALVAGAAFAVNFIVEKSGALLTLGNEVLDNPKTWPTDKRIIDAFQKGIRNHSLMRGTFLVKNMSMTEIEVIPDAYFSPLRTSTPVTPAVAAILSFCVSEFLVQTQGVGYELKLDALAIVLQNVQLLEQHKINLSQSKLLSFTLGVDGEFLDIAPQEQQLPSSALAIYKGIIRVHRGEISIHALEKVRMREGITDYYPKIKAMLRRVSEGYNKTFAKKL